MAGNGRPPFRDRSRRSLRVTADGFFCLCAYHSPISTDSFPRRTDTARIARYDPLPAGDRHAKNASLHRDNGRSPENSTGRITGLAGTGYIPERTKIVRSEDAMRSHARVLARDLPCVTGIWRGQKHIPCNGMIPAYSCPVSKIQETGNATCNRDYQTIQAR